VGSFNKKSDGTGTQTISDVGFQPSGLILASSNQNTNTAIQSDARISFGASDGTNERAIWFDDIDGGSGGGGAKTVTDYDQSTTKVAYHATTVNGSPPTIDAAADLSQFNGSGFNLNWTTNNGDQDEIIYVAFATSNPPEGGSFNFRKSITIDRTKISDGSCGTTLPDFPMLFSVTDGDLATTINGGDVASYDAPSNDPRDIIFRALDDDTCGGAGTAPCTLDHEIEKYVDTTGELVAWVRIPSVNTNAASSDTVIYIYYGNAGLTESTANPTGVWNDGGNNYFKGVWHLKEASGGSGAIKDSTSFVNHGTDIGSPILGSTGKIGGAIEFDGSNDIIRVDDSNAPGHELDFTAGPFTISAWINTQSINTHIIGKRDGDLDQYQFGVGGYTTLFFRAGNEEGWQTPPPNLSYNTWYYAAVVVNASEWPEIYVDGAQQPWTDASGDSRPHTFTHRAVDFSIGARWATDPTTAAHFDGFIDEVRVSSTARSSCWIGAEYSNQKWPNKDDFPSDGFLSLGSEESNPPTAIGLISFTATGVGNDVEVVWETGHEIANLGFNIYRATNKDGPFKKINSALIPGLNYSLLGKAYSYVDTDLSPGTLYYYKLEDIDVYGKQTFDGPICVDWDGDGMPDDWEIRYGLNPWVNDADIDSDGDGLTNREEYEMGFDPFNLDTDGDGILDSDEAGLIEQPDADGSRVLTRGVEVLSEDESGVTLELTTEYFDTDSVYADGLEFERIRIEKYIHGYTSEIGKPQMPIKGILIDIPEGLTGSLSIVETEMQTYSGYQIFPVPQAVVGADGATAAVGESFVQNQAAYARDAFYPQDAAELAAIYTFREQDKQQVVFYPLSFNGATGVLRFYTRIRVRIDYVQNRLAKTDTVALMAWKILPAGAGLSEQISSLGSMAAAFGASPLIVNPLSPVLSSLGAVLSAVWVPPIDLGASAYKIVTADAGIYRIYRADLALDDDLSRIRLYRLGYEVAIYIHDQNADNYLDAADYIEFYAGPMDETYAKYTNDNVYWLVTDSTGGSPKRMISVDGGPAGGDVATEYSFRQHQEQDAQYMGLAPGEDGLDRWYYGQYVQGIGLAGGPDPVPAHFALPIHKSQSPGNLTISLWGYSDTDHDLEVRVNGVYQDTFYWSGIAYNEANIANVDLKDSVIDQTAQSGSATTITLAAEASAVDDAYNEMLIEITAGSGSGQVRKITDYNGATRVATVDTNFSPIPDATSVYRLDTAVTLICDSGDDAFVVDWFEIEYERGFNAVSDQLQFAHDSGYGYVIDDFSSDDLLVYDITDPADVARIENGVINGTGPYDIEFEPPANPGATESYLVVSAADYKSPISISEDQPSDLADTDNEVDYILITHKDIGWDDAGDPYGWLDDLITLRQAQGLKTKVVDVADIYAVEDRAPRVYPWVNEQIQILSRGTT
jgi:hypothetical protein